MDFLIFCVVAALAYVVGLFGFAQIIGSLQNVRTRGIRMTVTTIVTWVVIMAIVWYLRNWFAPDQNLAYYAATAFAFIQILLAGKIQ